MAESVEEGNLPEMRVEHETNNLDVRDLWFRFQRAIEEVTLSVSSNSNAMRSSDVARLVANMKSLRDSATMAIKGPELDTPVTTPRKYELTHWFDDKRMLENDDLDHIKQLLVTARDELAMSTQSGRWPNGLHKFDGIRLISLLDRIDAHVKDVTLANNPMDYPETSPTREASPEGRSGI